MMCLYYVHTNDTHLLLGNRMDLQHMFFLLSHPMYPYHMFGHSIFLVKSSESFVQTNQLDKLLHISKWLDHQKYFKFMDII